jgi:CMP-N-acetylneuraminic acid synthetase
MNVLHGKAWALITARGGSKSIPLKNIHPVAGKPLLDYSLNALRACATVERVFCSTEHPAIAQAARRSGAEVLHRPEHLCGDLVNSVDVVEDAARTLLEQEGGLAQAIVLVQPTSIFLRAAHVDAAVRALLDTPGAMSAQTVVRVPHQFHAHNQRAMAQDGKDIRFAYPEERARGYSKQTKPAFYTYGNLIVTHARALLEGGGLFCRPSVPVVIPLEYAYDLDGYEDIPMAELMLERGMVELDPEDAP